MKLWISADMTSDNYVSVYATEPMWYDEGEGWTGGKEYSRRSVCRADAETVFGKLPSLNSKKLYEFDLRTGKRTVWVPV